ncbi:MAG TPA: hypothetical protein VIU62_24640, partial [Chloroflexota bacterium]
MHPVLLGSVLVRCADALRGETIQTIQFTGASSEHRWSVGDLDPEFPTDWSDYAYLVLELRAATPQRFYLGVQTAGGLRGIRLQPFGQGTWLRAAIPLSYFQGRDGQGHDMASAGNRPRSSYWFSVSGPFGTLEGVEALTVRMEHPVGEPHLDVRLLGLASEDPGSEILEALPVIDVFGQWRPGDWPGKVRNLGQLRVTWDQESERLLPGKFGYGRYGGYREHKAEATGFFRVEQRDGRWWFVDPDGCLFLSTGANVMRLHMATPLAGREAYFAALPPAELAPPALMGHRGPQASFFTWNLLRRFGPDWQRQWAALTVRRLDAWGFNTMYPGGPELIEAQPRKAYVTTVRGWPMEATYLGLPDVYAEDFAQQVDAAAARECAPRKDDPYLLGYFIGNEPPWPGHEVKVVDMVLAGPTTAIQRQARQFLLAGDTPERRVSFVLAAFERYLA